MKIERIDYRFLCKAVPEIVTHRGEMWGLLLQAVPQKPAIRIVEGDLLRCPPQRRQPVQMLDQHHLEQYHRVYARPAIVLTIQRLHHFIQPVEIHRSIYFPQQMILWHQAVYPHDLDHISFHFSSFQHLSHHHFHYTLYTRKSPAFAGFFRQAVYLGLF